MLRPRIIPCLTIDENSDLVKTINFKNRRYIGDVLNSVRIFNEKNADEIIVLDIDASVKTKKPNFKLIEQIASVCRMPFCYGGGIRNLEDAIKIFKVGVEKVCISSIVLEDIRLISKIANKVGSQSVAVCLDIKKNQLNNSFDIYSQNGKKFINVNLKKLISKIQEEGAGEIIFNSIDRDGTMKGFYYEILDSFFSDIYIPCSIIGGAGSYDDIKNVLMNYKLSGAVCGSFFFL